MLRFGYRQATFCKEKYAKRAKAMATRWTFRRPGYVEGLPIRTPAPRKKHASTPPKCRCRPRASRAARAGPPTRLKAARKLLSWARF